MKIKTSYKPIVQTKAILPACPRRKLQYEYPEKLAGEIWLSARSLLPEL